MGKALTARTLGELAALSRDLQPGPGAGAGALTGLPKEVIRLDRQRGRTRRDGCWLVPQRMEVRVSWGRVTLDFTEAVIMQQLLQLHAEVGSGTLTLLTRPGIDVDTDDVAVRSSGGVTVRAPAGPGVPVQLRIEVSGTIGSGHLRVRPHRWAARRWQGRRAGQ